MIGQILFLGTGGSAGIPMIGCKCPVCTSKDPCNKRLRPSAVIEWRQKKLLIDVGPDFRYQALKYGLDHLDGVLLTHSHYDHISGIDELRSYYLLDGSVLPVLLSRPTYEELKVRFHYLFRKKIKGKSLSAQLEFNILDEERGDVHFLNLPIRFMTYEQGGMKVNGFRFDNMAYISDIRYYPETIFEDLKEVDVLVVSALREKPSPLHLTVDEAIDFAQKVRAKRTFFTHIAHEIDHETISKRLPSGIELAIDGLKVEF